MTVTYLVCIKTVVGLKHSFMRQNSYMYLLSTVCCASYSYLRFLKGCFIVMAGKVDYPMI